jgi:hypothetical protein
MELDETLSAEQLKKLAEELSELSRQHHEALESAAFVGVSQLESKEYRERRSRIGKLCELLGSSGYRVRESAATTIPSQRSPKETNRKP